jgi:protein-disulfide isomerase
MSAKRAAAATIVLSIIGLAVSIVIVRIHAQLASSAGYASFCNVNENVNCDVVLASEYAHLAGIPVAWWALLAYAGFIVGAGIAGAAQRASQRRQAASALFAFSLWSFGFSLYLAYVALVVVQAVCLMCGVLYLVNAGLLVSTWSLFSAVREEGRRGRRPDELTPGRVSLVAGGAGVAVLLFLGLAIWEGMGADTKGLSAEEVAEQDPEFSRWYMDLPVTSVQVSGGHSKGGPARVVMVEFSDFECGHCARAFRNLKQVLPRFGSDVELVFHHYPLNASCNPSVTGSGHPYACLAAMASECAAAQGRFWEYHDLLFENQSALDRDSLLSYADRLALDRAAFVACLESEMPRRRIANDVELGKRLGVQSTPTFFLNGRTVAGALAPDKLEHAIRLERASSGKSEPTTS